MASIFSKIIAGDIPCHRIAENEEFLAFLDINPLAEGHTLVIPKTEVDCFFDLDDGLLARINLFARDVSHKIEAAIPPPNPTKLANAPSSPPSEMPPDFDWSILKIAVDVNSFSAFRA